MTGKTKKHAVLFLVFGAIAVLSASLPELGIDYFSGFDGLGKGFFLAVLVTTPASLLTLLFLWLLITDLYHRQKRLK